MTDERPSWSWFWTTAWWWIPRLLLAGVFAAAAVPKILDPPAFAIHVAGTGLVPREFVTAVAVVIPWIELVCAIALLTSPGFRPAASACMLALLLAFTVITVRHLVTGHHVSCGCFGSATGWLETPAIGLVRNLVLIALASALFIRDDGCQRRGA